jgi:hypothetical protein
MEDGHLVTILEEVISPVVLISGVGMLVLSMTNRFSHGQDRVRLLAQECHKLEGAARNRLASEIRVIRKRLRWLLLAITLGLGSVLLTALLILTLFANYLFGTTFRLAIVVIFALSLLSLVASLVLFIRDTSLSLAALEEEVRDIV